MQSFQEKVLSESFMPEDIPTAQTITFGIEHRKSKKFDDGKPLEKTGGNYKINAISVYWDNKHVLGVQIYYKIGQESIGEFLDAVHNKPTSSNKKSHGALFEIGPDDHLLEINGKTSADGAINLIGFSTYRGKVASLGVDDGIEFKHTFKNHTFGAFTGGYRDYLDFLTIPIIPVPKKFLEELKPIKINVTVNAHPQLVPFNAPGNSGGKKEIIIVNLPTVPPRSYTNPVPVNHQPVQQYQPQQFGQYQAQQPGQFQAFSPQNIQLPAFNISPIQYQSPPQQVINNNQNSVSSDKPITSSKYPILKK